MTHDRESIFFSSLRSFFKAIFALLGISVGIIPLILVISAMSNIQEKEPELNYKLIALPNANGVRKNISTTTPTILQIDINGIIGLESLTSNTIQTQLVESREGDLKNDLVKAVILKINSPGGTVVDADGIYRAVKAYKEKYKVPVVAYVDGMCASGGMYVAAAADKVYASDVSIVGSVGVLIPTFVNVSQLLEKIGVQTLTISAGMGKDDLNPLRPWKPGEADNFRTLVNYYYSQFVDLMVANRPHLDREKLIKDYGAKVFPAVESQILGYIDEAGISYNQIIERLVKEIGLEGKSYQVVKMESKNWFADLFKAQSPLFTGKIEHHVQIDGMPPSKLMNQFLYLYLPEKI